MCLENSVKGISSCCYRQYNKVGWAPGYGYPRPARRGAGGARARPAAPAAMPAAARSLSLAGTAADDGGPKEILESHSIQNKST